MGKIGTTLRAGAAALLGLFSGVPISAQTILKAAPADAPVLTFAQPEQQASLGAAYRAALDNLLRVNTVPYELGPKTRAFNQTGLLAKSPATFFRAGGGYDEPWTRDASVNSWNAGSLLTPLVARNTLWAVVKREVDGKLIVQQDNQWWDQTIWIVAAWNHFLVTGDRAFLANAYQTATNTLDREKQGHFNEARGLYEGPAFLNDGIAGYPAPPADATESRGSFVLAYPDADKVMALSTNCIYVGAYRAAAQMAGALGRPPEEVARFTASADGLTSRIRDQFWVPGAGRFGYLLFPDGRLDPSQEGAGLAFSLLFGVATPTQAASMLKAVHTEPYGLPDVWPAFPRYSPDHPGRHNVILWPPIQSFWADAAARQGDAASFSREVEDLARLVAGSGGHLWEIYNATSGAPDGGWQVGHAWESQPDQTWSASGYLRMIYAGLFGMRFGVDGLLFAPLLPPGWGEVSLSGLRYRGAVLTVRLRGAGNRIQSFRLDGKRQSKPEVAAELTGSHAVEITLSK